MKKMRKYIRRFVKYIKRTYQRKLFAIMLIAIGWGIALIDYDITCLVFISMFAVPLFFVDDEWFIRNEKILRGED